MQCKLNHHLVSHLGNTGFLNDRVLLFLRKLCNWIKIPSKQVLVNEQALCHDPTVLVLWDNFYLYAQ